MTNQIGKVLLLKLLENLDDVFHGLSKHPKSHCFQVWIMLQEKITFIFWSQTLCANFGWLRETQSLTLTVIFGLHQNSWECQLINVFLKSVTHKPNDYMITCLPCNYWSSIKSNLTKILRFSEKNQSPFLDRWHYAS